MIRLMIDPEDREQIGREGSRALDTGKLSDLHAEVCALLSLACHDADAMCELAGGFDEDWILLAEAQLSPWVSQTVWRWRARPQEDLFRLLRVRLAQGGVWAGCPVAVDQNPGATRITRMNVASFLHELPLPGS